MHAYDRYAYEMAPVRGTLMKWPMKDARLGETRLWDGLCEKHAYKSSHSRKRLLGKPASPTVSLLAVASDKDYL
jgi:hypothetical protein